LSAVKRFIAHCARGRNRGGKRLEHLEEVGDRERRDAAGGRVVAVAPVMIPFGSVEPWPAPTANFVASRSSLASWSSDAISDWSAPQSWPSSIENGTNACAFSTMMSGCASVGALSDDSVASALYAAVMAPDVTPSTRSCPRASRRARAPGTG
jgi:hypothetical protein